MELNLLVSVNYIQCLGSKSDAPFISLNKKLLNIKKIEIIKYKICVFGYRAQKMFVVRDLFGNF